MGQFFKFVFLFLWAQSARGNFTFGLQSGFGTGFVLNQLGSTADYLSQVTGQPFTPVPYQLDSDLNAALDHGTVQLLYSGASFFTCRQINSNIVPLATLVTYARNVPVSEQGAAIFVKTDSNITRYQDLRGRTIGTGQVSQLVGFQAQWETLKKAGVNIFTDTKGIFVSTGNQTAALVALAKGEVDAAFAAAALVDSLSPDIADDIRVLQPKTGPGYPYNYTDSLQPNGLISATGAINQTLRSELLKALIELSPDSNVSTSSGIYGYTAPDNYIPVIALQMDTGLFSYALGSCKPITDIFSTIICPFGFHLRGGINLNNSCSMSSMSAVSCPDGFDCICNPCERDKSQRKVGVLSVGDFIGIMVAVIAVLILFIFIVYRRYKLQYYIIPFKDLNVDNKKVIGQARQGLVLRGTFKNSPVAVKRAIPRRFPGINMFDEALLEGDLVLKRRRSSQGSVSSVLDNIHGCEVGLQESIFDALGISTERKKNIAVIQRCVHLQHPNVLRVFGVSEGEDESELLVISHFAEGGTLFELLRNPSFDMTLDFGLALVLDVARGLDYLHSQDPPILGRNLRSHHLLLLETYRCVIGVSFNRHDEQGRSILWQAPEVLRGADKSIASDIYGLGMLMFEVIHRHDPFPNEDPHVVVKAIRDNQADEKKRPVIAKQLPQDVYDIQVACWEDDPQHRPLISQIVKVLEQHANTSIFQSLMLGKQQADQLLTKILPKHAVDALQKGRRPSARSFDLVTVYFSDIKGYTSMVSESEKPDQVMMMLDDLYNRFDRLCNKYDLMKVETIGDAYMLVGGLREDTPNHAVRVAKFALEAVNEAAKVPKVGKLTDFLTIRSGFHSGPVTSGVVGTEVPRYCLFGDTVNIASRMESTGEGNRIQLTLQSVNLIKQQDPVLSQRIVRRPGDVEVKGKAPMQTFWLSTDNDTKRKHSGSAV